MKDRSILTTVGIILYVALSVVDQFVWDTPDGVYIPLALIGIGVIVAGFLVDKKRNRQ